MHLFNLVYWASAICNKDAFVLIADTVVFSQNPIKLCGCDLSRMEIPQTYYIYLNYLNQIGIWCYAPTIAYTTTRIWIFFPSFVLTYFSFVAPFIRSIH
jgi:hypothetical protein